jgi:hypothetical protein
MSSRYSAVAAATSPGSPRPSLCHSRQPRTAQARMPADSARSFSRRRVSCRSLGMRMQKARSGKVVPAVPPYGFRRAEGPDREGYEADLAYLPTVRMLKRGQKPVSRAAAAVIVVLWLALAVLGALVVVRMVRG